ncbi:MAG: hypothetical protein AUJ72_02205 [Candidatus Omnitrophica bacterium CG1_02_46_14]|nr:MAG: hypothetical protein AUJ72_02205 [Candidatus Omnitrophica bacterium CG1_02_46_14]
MLLEVRNLTKYFKSSGVKAVDDVSFSVKEGETLGIMGESGSGKSTLAKLILKLIPADSGQIFFEDKNISAIGEKGLKNFRKSTQIVFQEPVRSLDPRMTVEKILKEPFIVNRERRKEYLNERVAALLKDVELPEKFYSRTPHELSGGECQRVAIARAISLNPRLIVCDEAVSSLDALVRAQILNLLLKLQKERSMAYIFISHDLKVVRHMSDRLLIIKGGKAHVVN